ncbi:hypothetical protein D3C81_1383060 [compost metagenome]
MQRLPILTAALKMWPALLHDFRSCKPFAWLRKVNNESFFLTYSSITRQKSPNKSPVRPSALYSAPKMSELRRIGNHFMSQYQPYIHNQLLESINPAREPLLERQVQRQKFEQQLEEYCGRMPAAEQERNLVFLELQKLLDQPLRSTQQSEGGTEALQRFDAIGDPKAYFEKNWG